MSTRFPYTTLFRSTKQGNRGQAPTININSYYGWKNWTRFPRGVNAYQWMSGVAEAEMNQFGNTNISPEELSRWREGTEQGYRSFDWYDFMIEIGRASCRGRV